MAETGENLKFSKYFKRTSALEINIDKEDIFYRDKYNEIISYIKLLLSDSEDLEIYNHLKPKGTLLVNINLGTDILDYIKLISNHYYLELIELNLIEILKSPKEFLEVFNSILLNLIKKIQEKDKESKNIENKQEEGKDIKKRLILINQHKKLSKNNGEKSLFDRFISLFQENMNDIDLFNNNLILIWINYDYQELIENSDDLYEIFDLFIKIPILNQIERETILRNFSEKNSNIVFDVDAIVNKTRNWEIKDLKHLLKIGILKHHMKYDLNVTTNEITDILLELIESGEYIPVLSQNNLETKEKLEVSEEPLNYVDKNFIKNDNHRDRETIKSYINDIQGERYSEFMLNQLYENAASKNYNELIVIIDKLNKKEVIEENDRKILAKYPFILNDVPNLAQLNLEKAKKRIDLIKQAFGK